MTVLEADKAACAIHYDSGASPVFHKLHISPWENDCLKILIVVELGCNYFFSQLQHSKLLGNHSWVVAIIWWLYFGVSRYGK